MTTLKQRKLLVVKATRLIKKEGLSIGEAAERLGTSRASLGNWFYQQGVKLRPDNTQRNEDIKTEYNNGVSAVDLAEKYNLTLGQIYFINSGKKADTPANLGWEYHMNFTDIARVLGISERIVYNDYKRAMKKLKIIILEFDIELTDIIRVKEVWRR